MYILLVEDNTVIAHNIQKYLATKSIIVDIVANAQSTRDAIQQRSYDLIVMDVMLQYGDDGIAITQTIKAEYTIPIIIVTAKSQLEDKRAGFDAGADDYLTKPFVLEELFMRIIAVMQRYQSASIFVYKDVIIYPLQQRIVVKKQQISLTTKEWLIVQLLLDNMGTPVARNSIVEHVWGDNLFTSDGTLDAYISKLRKKLDKDIIITIKGWGYEMPLLHKHL